MEEKHIKPYWLRKLEKLLDQTGIGAKLKKSTKDEIASAVKDEKDKAKVNHGLGKN